MNGKPILEVKIEFDKPGFKMKTEQGDVTMIPFYGKVYGELFNGIVEPWGVDTQILNRAGVRHMSARYLLTGTDKDGQESHIYVENNAWFTDDKPSRTFKSVPTFYTDSKLLASYLHRNQFVGEGSMEADGLWIRFYEIEH